MLVIWSSPNQHGLTAQVKDRVIKGLSTQFPSTEDLHFNEHHMQVCRACGNGWGKCKHTGICTLNDDFQSIYKRICAAKGIVWITPVYWHDMSENLKCLLDRVRRCETAPNHHLHRKNTLLITCAGGSGRGGIQRLSRLETTLSHMSMITVGRISITQFNKRFMLPAIESAGESFARIIAQSEDANIVNT